MQSMCETLPYASLAHAHRGIITQSFIGVAAYNTALRTVLLNVSLNVVNEGAALPRGNGHKHLRA